MSPKRGWPEGRTRWVGWALGVAAGAALVHVVAVAALPRVIMGAVLRGASARAGENQCLHPPLATAESREVVRPSPDVAYSVAAFDVRERALHLVVPVTAPYTSVSGFAGNTDNFFAIDDREAHGAEIDVVIVGPGTPRGGLGGANLVEAPTDRGLVLVRRVVPDAAAFPAIDAARRRTRCELR